MHSNTSGVFKGFYKGRDGVGKFGGEAQNALKRIKGDIELKMPIFSNFSCEFEVVQKDANLLAKSLKISMWLILILLIINTLIVRIILCLI